MFFGKGGGITPRIGKILDPPRSVTVSSSNPPKQRKSCNDHLVIIYEMIKNDDIFYGVSPPPPAPTGYGTGRGG